MFLRKEIFPEKEGERKKGREERWGEGEKENVTKGRMSVYLSVFTENFTNHWIGYPVRLSFF